MKLNLKSHLQNLGDSNSDIFKEISAMSPKAIAQHLGFESINSKIFNDKTGKLESISNYIASAKGVKGETKDMTDEEIIAHYR